MDEYYKRHGKSFFIMFLLVIAMMMGACMNLEVVKLNDGEMPVITNIEKPYLADIYEFGDYIYSIGDFIIYSSSFLLIIMCILFIKDEIKYSLKSRNTKK